MTSPREDTKPGRTGARRWWLLAAKVVLTVGVTWLILRGAGFTLAEARTVDWTVVELDVPWLAVSLLLLLGTFAMAAALWSRVMAALGESPPPIMQAAAMLLVANLGRYIPTKVAQLAGVAVLARRAGLSGVRATGAAIVAQVLNLTAAALLGGWVVYGAYPAEVWSLLAGIGAVLAMVGFLGLGGAGALMRWVFRRLGHDSEVPATGGWRLLRWLPAYVVNWLLLGVAFKCLGLGLGMQIPLWFASTAFAAAYLAGYIAIFAPAGIGVREGSLVFLLTPTLGPSPAFVLAALQRVWLTGAEFSAAVAGAMLLRKPGPAKPPVRPAAPAPQGDSTAEAS